jgi:hypothetical protein
MNGDVETRPPGAPAVDTPGKGRRLGMAAGRLLLLVLAAAAIGWTLNRIGSSLGADPRPAGFFRGMIQGALMPMSLPNLLVGHDVQIYSVNNTGVSYKLGYTSGVNVCGTIFFGFFFWRLRRLRQWANTGRGPG